VNRWTRGAAALVLAAALVAGCSGNDKKDSSSSTSSTSTSSTSDAVSLEDAARVVQQEAPDLLPGQAAPLLDSWCAAARSGDRTQLVSQLRSLPSMSEPVLDEVLGALQKGAQQHCPKDAADAPDLLSKTSEELISSTTTAAAAPGPSTTALSARTASARTATTVHHATATTASAPGTTASTASTTSTSDPCDGIGNTTSGVMVGNGGASSCSHGTGG
jgi:outer membrane murein-binding lipoprotein Lpp